MQANPNIPSSLQEVIQRALEKDKSLRYQTAADMRADLKQLKRDMESGASVGVGGTGSGLTPTASRSLSASKQWALNSAHQTSATRSKRVPKIIDSLAVLPFGNAGGDPEHEYLSDGITGSLINILATVPKLRVARANRVGTTSADEACPLFEGIAILCDRKDQCSRPRSRIPRTTASIALKQGSFDRRSALETCLTQN